MVNELDMQTAIIKAVREKGGWARKWASDTQVGMPDLIIKVPAHDVVFMEVKYHRKRFVRDWTISITPRQRQELIHWHHAGACAMIGVVEDGGSRDRFLWALSPWAVKLGGEALVGPYSRVRMPYGGVTNVPALIEHFRLRSTRIGPREECTNVHTGGLKDGTDA